MNALLPFIILAIVQGITEFLPISSSAHLILVPLLAGWDDQGLAFDIAVHVGSLLAVIVYFRNDLLLLIKDFFGSIFKSSFTFSSTPSQHRNPLLSWQLMIATLPIALIGWVAHDLIATTLRSPLVIAVATIGFGGLLFLSDYFSVHKKTLAEFQWRDAIIIGLAQALALIPGTSRSGITLTAGLALGFDRKSSATFSFLLSVPVIVLAGGYEAYKMLLSPHPVPWGLLSIALLFSSVTAYLCIHFFMRFIQTIGMLPFFLYRLCLGGILLFMFY